MLELTLSTADYHHCHRHHHHHRSDRHHHTKKLPSVGLHTKAYSELSPITALTLKPFSLTQKHCFNPYNLPAVVLVCALSISPFLFRFPVTVVSQQRVLPEKSKQRLALETESEQCISTRAGAGGGQRNRRGYFMRLWEISLSLTYDLFLCAV